jgi:hypothetical protein
VAVTRVKLYHRRWRVETTQLSIRPAILDGRVLRSRHPTDIDQSEGLAAL